MRTTTADTLLLQAIMQVAREECQCEEWGQLEPVLAATWERLRTEGASSWSDVVHHVQAACESEGLIH